MHRLFAPCLLLALALAPGGASAFGEEGHRMVGEIATRFLDATAAKEVETLLANDRLADGEPSGRRSLAAIASWADEIKDFAEGKRHSGWHYDDISLCGEADPARYCRYGNCASAQIARHVEILGNRRATRRARNEALKWVVHLVGDIHQPLHAATRRDRGGNNVEVAFFGERDNPPYGTIRLHTVWDFHMVRRLIREKGGEEALMSGIGAGERAAWEQGTLADWVAESHAIARDHAYAALPVAVSCTARVHEVVAIGEAYYAKAAPVIESRLKKAGVRLARILNETLGR